MINFDPAIQRRVRDEILKADLDSLSISLSKSNCVSLSIKEIRVFFLESIYDLSTPPCISIYSDSDESGRLGFPMISIETKSKATNSMVQSYYDEFSNRNPQTVFSKEKTSYGDDTFRQSVEKPATRKEIEKFKASLLDTSLTMARIYMFLYILRFHIFSLE